MNLILWAAMLYQVMGAQELVPDLEFGNRTMESEWVIKFNDLSWTADIEVHISCVIIAYTLELLSSLT